MPSLNGYGQLNADETTATTNTVAEKFITDGLSKVLKINNICSHTDLKKCGIPDKFKNMAGKKRNFPTDLTSLNARWHDTNTTHVGQTGKTFSTYNTMAAAFETANGESIAVIYAPNCQSYQKLTTNHQYYGYVCANFIYDLNGRKGPNTYGKDIGHITVFYPFDSEVVSAMPYKSRFYKTRMIHGEAIRYCRSLGREWKLPNLLEMDSIVLNRSVIDSSMVDYTIYTSTLLNNNYVWSVGVWSGNLLWPRYSNSTDSLFAICIKR